MAETGDQRTKELLIDLKRFGEEAAFIVTHGENAYLASTNEGALLRNAGERVLIKVATVVEKLPDSFKAAFPEMDWIAIRRMRNLVAHHYDKVNDELMWRALAQRIPQLMADLSL
ncbi:MAG: DUF86 domain-containing protein [Actinomycetaceae bacterium]|nr:DUF86 domain-containing protein [Actinomycetaceae bacterium]